LAGLSAPILSVVGSKDAVVDPAVCRSVAEFNDNVSLVECEASGHAPFIDEPAKYHQAVLDFVNKHL